VASRNDVESFLERFKAVAQKDGIYFVPRDKNIEALAELGLSVDDRREMVMTLSAENYVKGPCSDDSGTPGEIWCFGRTDWSSPIYIKLKLGDTCAKCISFHKAEFGLTFPCLRQTI
jgi:hypothetical protein